MSNGAGSGVAASDPGPDAAGCVAAAVERAATGDAVDAARKALALVEAAACGRVAVGVLAARVGATVAAGEVCVRTGMADPTGCPPPSAPEMTHGMTRARRRMAPVMSGTAEFRRRPGCGANRFPRRPNTVCFTGCTQS